MKTLAEAAAAYCEAREQLKAIRKRLDSAPFCTADEDAIGAHSCLRRTFPHSVEDFDSLGRWWEQSDAVLSASCCASCLARVPIYRERHTIRRRLAGLASAMFSAYRREAAK